MKTYLLAIGLLLTSIILFFGCHSAEPNNWKWKTVAAKGAPTARHEAGLVAYKDQLILLGGRRINPTSVYDTKTNTWTEQAAPPIEIHHFQPVVVDDAIYIVGAMTGPWPNEKPIEKVLIYYPETDVFEYGHDIPEHRRRGGAGAVYYNGKIYLVGGITNGHMDGYRNWFDSYDPKTGVWETLPNAQSTRDHFQLVAKENKIYAFAGRSSSHSTGEDMSRTISHGNVYDFKLDQWEEVTNDLAIPTQRAGNMAFVWGDQIIIGGGESMKQKKAHSEIEAFDVTSNEWKVWPSLNEGRHGTGFAIVGNHVYTASGCGNRGGNPELTTIERLELPTGSVGSVINKKDDIPVYAQWHTVTLPFEGPKTSEKDEKNPFFNYKLVVDFTNNGNTTSIRGFYAADGNASESSAEEGNVWKVRFTPPQTGTWMYKATLYEGEKVALSHDLVNTTTVDLSNSEGVFEVIPTDKQAPDFRASGRLVADNGYFRFESSKKYWLKAGTNSPENLLAYKEFDGTYRISAGEKDGEATAPDEIHSFGPHIKDWQAGDPSWKGDKGKAIIGAMNYLSSKGMNSAYFLTMNILGDGKDVWPYIGPEEFTRFDVSRLAQWEVLFQHMQAKGILLHMVLQETENETMLDEGDTGPLRQLYFNEMIARFGHHLGLVWNLGEENGPASWSPIGQNDAQRKAMAKYLKENDPYNHPVLLHTHSHDPLRSDILNDIKGFEYVDGLSLQVDRRKGAGDVVAEWRTKSIESGQPWLITMDEIGMWHTAVMTDREDPYHTTIRRYALWGTLLSGSAGVEWYFGAKHPHNDLSSEDWRERDQLWTISNHARLFFERHLPYWEMKAAKELISGKDPYCLAKEGVVYAIYVSQSRNYSLDLSEVTGDYSVQWYSVLKGGELQDGSVVKIPGGGIRDLGKSPNNPVEDWVILVKKIEE